MSAPIEYFLQHYKKGKYVSLVSLLQEMGINDSHILERQFPSLKQSQDPLLAEFKKEGTEEIYFWVHQVENMYHQYKRLLRDSILYQEIKHSFDTEPNEAIWALQSSPWEKAPTVLKKLKEAEKEKHTPIVTGKGVSHMFHIPESYLPKNVTLPEFQEHVKSMKEYISVIQENDILQDLEKVLDKKRFIREQPPEQHVRYTTAEQREYDRALRHSRSKRKSPPKYSLLTKKLVLDPEDAQLDLETFEKPLSMERIKSSSLMSLFVPPPKAVSSESDYVPEKTISSRDVLADKGKRRKRRKSVYRRRY
jgi:hypothetical protein